jgi:transcriptional regulator with XRE-family HTH domain
MRLARWRAMASFMSATTIGDHLRVWRQRRRMSQLDLALEAEISQRHLSFVESGRATPSRDMVLRLADQLEVPLREQNTFLVAAGYAPMFAEHSLEHPAMASARDMIDRVLAAHEPAPAIVIDRHWTLIAANRMVTPFNAGVAERLLTPPVNVLRLTLDPEGLAPRIENLGEWRAHLFERLRRQRVREDDTTLKALYEELSALPGGDRPDYTPGAIAVPFRLRTPNGVLSFLSMTMVFGGPRDVTIADLAIEIFLPEDAATAAALAALASAT